MTFREKLQNEYPNADIDEIVRGYCPDCYGYEEESKCGDGAGWNCEKCWNREMPNTEPKSDGIPVIPQSEVNASINGYRQGRSEGYNEGLNDGRNDAWELCKKLLCDNTLEENLNALGYIWTSDIIKNYTPQEALAKLKAYEEQKKIEVGDIVVIPPNEIAVVTKEKEKDVYVCFSDGSGGYFKKDACKKIGKHIDIKTILEQIGE